MTSRNNRTAGEAASLRGPAPGKVALQWNTRLHISHNRGSVSCGSAQFRVLSSSESSRRRELNWSEWVSRETAVGELTAEGKYQMKPAVQRLAWDGRQPARTWARKQRNVRRREPLPSNASEDCEESSVVRQLVNSETVSGSTGSLESAVRECSPWAVRAWGIALERRLWSELRDRRQSARTGAVEHESVRRWEPLPGDNRWRHSRLRGLSACCGEL
jgi:hypothetical protein